MQTVSYRQEPLSFPPAVRGLSPAEINAVCGGHETEALAGAAAQNDFANPWIAANGIVIWNELPPGGWGDDEMAYLTSTAGPWEIAHRSIGQYLYLSIWWMGSGTK
jgi:hypothetical protein